MSLHENSSMILTKDVTRLNIKSLIQSGTHLNSLRNDEDSDEASNGTDKIRPKSPTTFSIFGEGSCGEPQTAQHLQIDFTHKESDDDFVQMKCCDFWEFIESHSEIHHLMVMPNSQTYPSTPTFSEGTKPETKPKPTTVTLETPVVKEHTAVSMLDMVDRGGLIDKCFEAKIPQLFCPLGSREYIENETSGRARRREKENLSRVCKCSGKCKTCHKNTTVEEKVTHASADVQDMCENLEKWDMHHPKSMEPPGHALPLIHCVMQRHVS